MKVINKISKKNNIGAGFYTVSDISNLLGMPQPKVRRYLKEYWDNRLGRKLFNDTYTWENSKKTKAVNFYVLIELFTCFQLQELGVSIQKIVKAREAIATELNTQYPFASAGVLTNGKRIWYEVNDSVINADGSRQSNLIGIIKEFASKIEFNDQNLAERFYPAGKKNSVIVDPHHQFGLPVIKGTNINTEIILSLLESGEKIESIKVLYDLSNKEVKDVIEFYHLAG
ncbi:MAG: DUF433 domain-containing protein [Bacteroidetes bacterium]|nr:DUF433 domain-containing protein [Bacteroidota bacterium]HET6245505.1 DUF433 domain-containing protein [Bacteroidia bacterium]